MPTFSLLRLPGVVLCEVFKSLSIGEKIKLSLCSKKISAQINIARLYSEKVIVDLGRVYCIYLKGSKDEIMFWNQISNKLKLVEDLELSSILKPDFNPVFTSWPQKIGIIRSAWFSLEYLLTCTCTTIELDWSHLGMTDFNTVLKNWKTGGFPNLEYLYVEGQNIQNNGTMNWSRMVIQTDDGSKKATINTRYNRIKMYVTPFD
ncbi:hypothetical protein CRE_24287 [Caenorhabditis remanei]|uniref:F-box domain-containing protein n=1 Tax=Caenorhabditis remanei TaxID=31234 RepID=E3NLB9_CAERE|nr:hypothetical protein CRE_24287 [Caenorhabditis remanei]